MADDRKEGWEPWTPERERGGSGVGAFTGENPGGDHGLEGHKRDAPAALPEDEAQD